MVERILYPASKWHEDDGSVIWWRFPICEPPYVGGPLDLGFAVGAKLFNQFGDVISTVQADVGGWPFGIDLDKQHDLFWERLIAPEMPGND